MHVRDSQQKLLFLTRALDLVKGVDMYKPRVL